MPDSGDCSDAEMNQPSCSRKAVQKNNDREKKNRRIIMRIEFSDSDDTDADDPCLNSNNGISASAASSSSASLGGDIDLGSGPSCSSVSQLRRSTRSNNIQQTLPIMDSNSNGAPRRSERHLRRRELNSRHRISREPCSDGTSSSGSEVKSNLLNLIFVQTFIRIYICVLQ